MPRNRRHAVAGLIVPTVRQATDLGGLRSRKSSRSSRRPKRSHAGPDEGVRVGHAVRHGHAKGLAQSAAEAVKDATQTVADAATHAKDRVTGAATDAKGRGTKK